MLRFGRFNSLDNFDENRERLYWILRNRGPSIIHIHSWSYEANHGIKSERSVLSSLILEFDEGKMNLEEEMNISLRGKYLDDGVWKIFEGGVNYGLGGLQRAVVVVSGIEDIKKAVSHVKEQRGSIGFYSSSTGLSYHLNPELFISSFMKFLFSNKKISA